MSHAWPHPGRLESTRSAILKLTYSTGHRSGIASHYYIANHTLATYNEHLMMFLDPKMPPT